MRGAVCIQSYLVPKDGNSTAECEDRFSARDKHNVLLSLSDGATQSAFSGEWATHLVNSDWKFALISKAAGCEGEVPDQVVSAWLMPLRQQFEGTHSSRNLPWYVKEKLKRGAHATFLAFRMRPSGRWIAVSCGDTCLLTIRGNQVEDSVPLRSPNEFSNRPTLVSSRANAPLPSMVVHHGQWGADTVLVLATDALACWLLENEVSGGRARRLLECRSQGDFEALIAEERRGRELKNDDTTALIVRSQSLVQ